MSIVWVVEFLGKKNYIQLHGRALELYNAAKQQHEEDKRQAGLERPVGLKERYRYNGEQRDALQRLYQLAIRLSQLQPNFDAGEDICQSCLVVEPERCSNCARCLNHGDTYLSCCNRCTACGCGCSDD